MPTTLEQHAPYAVLPDRLTRAQTAVILGVHRQRVFQLERAGKLVGQKDERGVVSYDKHDVWKLACMRAERAIDGTKRGSVSELDGRLVARIFSYFRLGWSLADVVIKEELSPVVVRGLFAEYNAPLGKPSPPWYLSRRGRPRKIRSVLLGDTSEPIGTAFDAVTKGE
jgi:hypothetical protein